MKFVAITLLASLVAVAMANPVSISDNNVGDIVTVGINAKAELSNKIDQNIFSVIIALLNQQAIVAGNDEPQPNENLLAPAEIPQGPVEDFQTAVELEQTIADPQGIAEIPQGPLEIPQDIADIPKDAVEGLKDSVEVPQVAE